MKRFQSLALFSALSFLFISTLGLSSNAQNKDAVVAAVGNKTITVEDFNRKYNEIKNQTVNPPTKAQFLEDLIRYEVGLKEA